MRLCRIDQADRAISQTRIIMILNVSLQPLIALIAEILILLFPRLLNFVVAIYLIIIGVLGLMGRPI